MKPVKNEKEDKKRVKESSRLLVSPECESSRLLVSPECFAGHTKFFCGQHVRHPCHRICTFRPRKWTSYGSS